jgi:hypothetical protein
MDSSSGKLLLKMLKCHYTHIGWYSFANVKQHTNNMHTCCFLAFLDILLAILKLSVNLAYQK